MQKSVVRKKCKGVKKQKDVGEKSFYDDTNVQVVLSELLKILSEVRRVYVRRMEECSSHDV